jgi:competence protein ComFC
MTAFRRTAPTRHRLVGSDRAAYQIYRTFWNALDWIFPPTCGGCGRPTERWCSDCQNSITEITEKNHICRTCGDMLDPTDPACFCKNCLDLPPSFQNARSCVVFKGPIREAIHRLKYKQDLGLGESLSCLLIKKLDELKWPVDLVCPVPLSDHRLRERGYNQSGLLARPVALANNIPYVPSAIRRVRVTQSQVGLSAKERAINLKNAFFADPAAVNGHSILIIDDVMTTGVTLRNCADALMKAQATMVYCLTLARAVIHQDGFERG